VGLSFGAIVQETQSQEPPPEETSPPSSPDVPAETPGPPEASSAPDDEKLTIEEMKALADGDLRALYVNEPWRLPENFGEDSELLDRVMRVVHPEMEPESESTEHTEPSEQQETPETTPKPKPEPDAR
jgi:hypothetical protein